MISRCRRWLAVVGAAAMLALHGSAAVAQSTPMRFIVGLAPGGAVDPYARIIADHMAKTLGRTIIIDNRPGAGGNISAHVMTDAPARKRSLRSTPASTATCAGRSTTSCR
jgi:tripartite-type tricarboxylate transporter receptor subunit TctC